MKTMADLNRDMQDADRSLQLNEMMRSFMSLMKDGIKSKDAMKKLEDMLAELDKEDKKSHDSMTKMAAKMDQMW